MATQVVELTGDEARLLRALDRVIAKEREHERALNKMGEGADQAGLQFEDAMARIEAANKEAIDNTIKQLGRMGPEGKRAAEALQNGFAEFKGAPSVDDLLKKISTLDDESAAVVQQVNDNLAKIEAVESFDATIKAMQALGGESAKVAIAIQESLKGPEKTNAFEGYLTELSSLVPEASDIAAKIRAEIESADRQDAFNKTIASMKQAGGEAAAVAEQIQKQLRETTAITLPMDDYLKQLQSLVPEAADVAAKVRAELEAADQKNAFDKTIAAMKQAGGEAAKVAEEIQKQLRETAAVTLPMDDYLKQLQSLVPEAADVAAKVRAELESADRKDAFDQTIASMKQAGGEAAAVANEIAKRFKESSAVSISMEEYIAGLQGLVPEAANVAAKIKAELATADQKANFEATLTQLRALGPEGKSIADGIAEDLKRGAIEAAGGMDVILAKLKEFDPAIGDTADKLKAAFNAAAANSQVDSALKELAKINPEAAKAASAVREKMELADAEVKFDNIIAELRKIDPVAAEEAAKLRQHMKTVDGAGNSPFKSFSKSVVAELGAVAGAYLGVSEAIQFVNQYLSEQNELVNKSLDAQKQLAKAQTEAAKNLAAYTAVERDSLLQSAVPEIATKTNFGDVSKLTLALGSAASAGASPQEAKAAVTAAARMERLTPDKIEATTGGAVSVMKQTGLADPRQAITLLQTAGPLSKIDDAAKVSETLPRALGTVATVPKQSPQDAAREVASFFATATNRGVDSQGMSSATFTIDFMNRMNAIFTDLENKQIDARSKIELIDRKIEKGKDTEANRRDKAQLEAFLKETATMTDPATIAGRLQVLQANPAMQQQFLGETGKFGEQQFQVFLKEILDKNSQANQDFRAGVAQIKTDVSAFEQAVAGQTSTPQQVIANATAAAEAAVSARRAFDNSGSSLAAVREITASVLENTRSSGLSGFGQYIGETGIRSGVLGGSTAIEEAASAMDIMQTRIQKLREFGVTAEEQKSINVLETGLKQLETLVVDAVKTGGITQEEANAGLAAIRERSNTGQNARVYQFGVTGETGATASPTDSAIGSFIVSLTQAINKQNELMVQQNALLERTANNTDPEEPNPIDYAANTQDRFATEDAR